MDHYGALSLIPAAVVIITALLTRRTLEPLLLGSIVGFVIVAGKGFFSAWLDAVYVVMMDGTTAWVILVCGLFGSLVALLEKSGGAMGFTAIASKFIKNRKAALAGTWILGIIVFIDDYLNALAVGTAMRKITDNYKVPREFLAYVINSTGATVCVLIPFSTWSAFMAGQMEASGAAAAGMGTAAYISTVPFILYGWAAVLIVPLFFLNVIPVWGPMRKAEKRAAELGQTFPDSTVAIAQKEEENQVNYDKTPRAMNFIIPMLVLGVVCIVTSDMLIGVIVSLVVCIVLYLPQKLMKPSQFGDICVDGFKDMILVLAIVCAAFFLQQANDALGLTPYVIEKVEPILSPTLLPAISFIVIGLLAFATGSFWGVAAIAFPIIVPLAVSMDVNVLLACGAVISGAAFGSHSCFYSDAVTLTCASSQIQNSDYARTVLPILGLPLGVGLIAFIIAGVIM
ncbi:MAG: Na+/H+ antiporter NhaC family protein [Eubacteriales bacterium]|nr:Na+/H+ antiporter NhaC family protein [Eubacteriales bacterium]MDD3350047.1 Na+/H+ antiporter NhaC family protein [Eubacteriales bacterium]